MDKIGDIIRAHRSEKNMTQEDLGKLVFVSKQAVSKWETGKTMPDLDTIKKLCEILDISNDEILGGSVEETKRNRRWLKFSIVTVALSLLVALFFIFDGAGYIDRHTQSGVAYITVFENGVLLKSDEYSIESDINATDLENGYSFNVDYGEVKGTVAVHDDFQIEYGFINTNNWQNINIRLDVVKEEENICVRQTVSYKTDGDIIEVLASEAEGVVGGRISVFREGV